MGFFDLLFGGGKKAEAPPVVRRQAAPVPAEFDPKIPAAIAAGVMSAAIAAAVVAAVVHTQGGAAALRFKRPGNIWALSGRQAVMASHQF